MADVIVEAEDAEDFFPAHWLGLDTRVLIASGAQLCEAASEADEEGPSG